MLGKLDRKNSLTIKINIATNINSASANSLSSRKNKRK